MWNNNTQSRKDEAMRFAPAVQKNLWKEYSFPAHKTM